MSKRITLLLPAVLVGVVGCSQYAADPAQDDVREDIAVGAAGQAAAAPSDAPEGSAGSDIRAIAQT